MAHSRGSSSIAQRVTIAFAVFATVGALLFVQAPPASALNPVYFSGPTMFDTGAGAPKSIASADFNGDNIPDIAAASATSHFVEVLLGVAGGGFGAPTTYDIGAQPPLAVAIGDFNGDDDPDIVSLDNSTRKLAILRGEPGGSFADPIPNEIPLNGPAVSVAVADFNDDNDPDIAVGELSGLFGNPYSGVDVLLGSSDASFGPPVFYPFPDASSYDSIAVGDFDQNGTRDVAAAAYDANLIRVLSGAGDGTFALSPSTYGTGDGPTSITRGDFNGDGRDDVATANENSDDVSVLLGAAGGGFSSATNTPVGDGPDGIAAADLNADGDLDLATSNAWSDNVSVLLGDAGGAFAAAQNFAATNGPHRPLTIASADLNLDSRPDLVTSVADAGAVSVLLNHDGPVNAPPTVTVASGGTCRSDDRSGTINLVVADAETAASSLTLSATSSNSSLVPNSGVVFGGSGANRTMTVTAVNGASGNATVTVRVSDGQENGTVAISVKVGTNMANTIAGDAGTNMVFARNGNDVVTGGGSNDLLCGGAGNDTLRGVGGADTIYGGGGNDTILGGDGNDRMLGEAGNDMLTGGLGADQFSGGMGSDTATDVNAGQGDTTDGT